MTYLIPTRILLLLLFLSSLVAAANFAKCLEDLRNDPNATDGVDSHGHPTSPAQAVGFTYKACTTRCGSGAGSSKLKDFTQSLFSWLLPWLALISELPFGSGNYADDLVSVFMSIGSPALAAYSLMLTSLNVRSVYRRAKRIDHRSNVAVARALIPLQQIPLELTKDRRLLAFIPIDDQWSREILDWFSWRRDAWSAATGTSITWATIVLLSTLVDSFVSLDGFGIGGSTGLSLDTLWLWLPCLVIGWLWVPAFANGKLRSTIHYGGQPTVKKAAMVRRSAREMVRERINSAKSVFTDKILKTLRGSRQPMHVVTEALRESERAEEQSIQNPGHAGQETDQETNPVPFPAHHQSIVSLRLSYESQQHYDYLSVSANPIANQSVVSVARSAKACTTAESPTPLEMDDLLILKNPNPLNRDEFRFAAAFNYSRIMHYLILVDDVFGALDKLARERDERRRSIFGATTQPTKHVIFPPGALASMLYASILALILQCGTTASASLIAIFTPTVGVGCRSLGYIIYGGASIIIMFLTMISTILARISETRDESTIFWKRPTAFIAIILRRISLFLAFANTMELIGLSCLQLSNVLDSCYCTASVIGRGTDSYVLVIYDDWISTMRNSRITGVILSAVSMATYMIFLWFTSASPANVGDL